MYLTGYSIRIVGAGLPAWVDSADGTLVMTQQLLLLATMSRCDVQITGIDDAQQL